MDKPLDLFDDKILFDELFPCASTAEMAKMFEEMSDEEKAQFLGDDIVEDEDDINFKDVF